MKSVNFRGIWFIYFLIALSCESSNNQNETIGEIAPYQIDKPAHFPAISIPADNPMSAEKVALGEALFFDPILSSDTTISCASCHFAGYAFSDTVALSLGVNDSIGKRNAPSLMNVAYASSLFRDGGAPNLEMQIFTPIEDDHEMNLDIDDAVERLRQNATYVERFKDVFDTLPTVFGLTRAIAAYERTLIGGTSKYDRFLVSGDSSIFDTEEKLGLQLFFSSRLNCVACHAGFNFTDDSFRNNGIYVDYSDWGHANLSMDSSDIGKFRVPSLRNVTLTGPYMHDGSLNTIEAVIRHYAAGGKNHFNTDSLISGFDISDSEIRALSRFLHSLTDE